jgi:lipoprotein signal peptidase
LAGEPIRVSHPADQAGVRSLDRQGGQVVLFWVVLGVVVLSDQVSKWWGWRHAGNATIDTGGGVLNEITAGLASGLMQDPVAGAAADVVLAAVLVVLGCRLLSRTRTWPVLLTSSMLVAAGFTNLLDRFGLHLLTAPGSARGDVNWIAVGGRGTSPLSLADLFITAAACGLTAVIFGRFMRARLPPGTRRTLLVTAACALTLVSLAGAFHASNGVRARESTVLPRAGTASPASPLTTSTGAVGAPAPNQLGAPAVSAPSRRSVDAIGKISISGLNVSVGWEAETVTVTAQTVLGWRTDGVSTLYLHALVVGPQTVELYLPPQQSHAVCQWSQPAQPSTASSTVWECNPGTPQLSLDRSPVLFP